MRRRSRSFACIVAALIVVAGAAPLAAFARPGGRPSAGAVYAGLGSWLDIFASGFWSRPTALVAAAKEHHVGTLYLQTSNYSQSSDVVRPAALGAFVDAAHAAGLRVVAWYLPGFANTDLDRRRALAAIQFRSQAGQHFDAFALDIEASVVSNVSLRTQRLLTLARFLRHMVPQSYPLGAIIPSPVGMDRHPHYWPHFPYAGLASSFDAFLPMAYFSYYAHTPAAAYAYARQVMIETRARTGRPDALIHLIGGSASAIPPTVLAGFIQAGSDCGAQGISLYAFPETNAQDWTHLAYATLGRSPAPACQP